MVDAGHRTSQQRLAKTLAHLLRNAQSLERAQRRVSLLLWGRDALTQQGPTWGNERQTRLRTQRRFLRRFRGNTGQME